MDDIGREIHRRWLLAKWNDLADRLVDMERRKRGQGLL